ncbi:MAG TPA: hypothetical protein VF780_06815 [Nitrosospira sp.]
MKISALFAPRTVDSPAGQIAGAPPSIPLRLHHDGHELAPAHCGTGNESRDIDALA